MQSDHPVAMSPNSHAELSESCLHDSGIGPEIAFTFNKVQYVAINCHTNGIQQWAVEGSFLNQKTIGN